MRIQQRWALAALAATLSCGDPATTAPDAFTWSLPPGFPTPWVSAENPMSAAKVELGRHLFYDPRLSGNGTQSCATCHEQVRAFSEARATSIGSLGGVHPRNALGLTNSAYSGTLTWANPLLTSLEMQIPVPMFGSTPVELGMTGHEAEIAARLAGEPLYVELFAAAFTEDPTPGWPRIRDALASFVRTLISGNSPHDRFRAGDLEALSHAARRGAVLFFSERLECYHCHGGFNFTTSTQHEGVTGQTRAFHNNGLYNLDAHGAYPPDNPGLIEHTGEPLDMGRFRAPTLRNVAVTAPYMHDGSLPSLEAVLRMYERGGRLIEDGPFAGDGALSPLKNPLVRGFTLTDGERDDVIAFLDSLTDDEFLTDPRLADPWPHISE